MARVAIGITAERHISGDHFIIQVKPGTPAAEAGLCPGWIIKAVDFRQVRGLEASQVQSAIMGLVNSSVTLTVQRTNAHALEHFLIFRREARSHLSGSAKGTKENPLSNLAETVVGLSQVYGTNKIADNASIYSALRPNNSFYEETGKSSLSEYRNTDSGNDPHFPLRASNSSSTAVDVDGIVEELMKRRLARIEQSGANSQPSLNGRLSADGKDSSLPPTDYQTPDRQRLSRPAPAAASFTRPQETPATELPHRLGTGAAREVQATPATLARPRSKLLSVGSHPLMFRCLEPDTELEGDGGGGLAAGGASREQAAFDEDLAAIKLDLQEKLHGLAEAVQSLAEKQGGN
jgi:hypothetical protein